MLETNETKILLYGNSWCSDSYRAKMLLSKYEIEFVEIDIEKNREGLEFVVNHNNGNQSVPTILFPDGTILVEPSNQELREQLNIQ